MSHLILILAKFEKGRRRIPTSSAYADWTKVNQSKANYSTINPVG